MMGLRHLVSGIVAIVSLVGIISIQQKQISIITGAENTNYVQQEKAERLILGIQSKMPRLGFNNLMADWNYLQFIQYFGDTPARNITGYTLIPEYFSAVVKDDPRFIKALLSLSPANTLYSASPKTTVTLLNKALTKITPEIDPLTPYVWSYKGIDEMLFLGDSKTAQKSYETAADWALKTNSNDKEALAKRNRETAAFLANNPNSKKAKVAAWMFILSGGINEETQKLAIREIISLGGKVSVTPEGYLEVQFPEQD